MRTTDIFVYPPQHMPKMAVRREAGAAPSLPGGIKLNVTAAPPLSEENDVDMDGGAAPSAAAGDGVDQQMTDS